MRIISRYVLKHFLPIFALALFAFVGLYLIIDFFEKIDDVLEEGASLFLAWLYFVYKIPLVATQGVPMASLLGTLLALGILNRNRELIALRASGVKPLTYMAPVILAAFLLSGLDFGVTEFFARPMSQKAQRIWQHKIMKKGKAVQWSKENVWYRGENLIYQIHLYDGRRQVMEKVSLYYLNEDFQLSQRLDAERLRWMDNQWIAEEGLLLKFEKSGTEQEIFKKLRLNLHETPKDFADIETIPAELGWLDLYDYAEKIGQEGYDSATYWVELHMRIAFPLTTLILTLLGAAISLRQGPAGGIPLGVGIALIVAFLYLTVLQVGSSLATAGILPPFVGVWAGNIIFTIGSIYLWMTTPQ
jgi:lipopolysaccharide export system permease protein